MIYLKHDEEELIKRKYEESSGKHQESMNVEIEVKRKKMLAHNKQNLRCL